MWKFHFECRESETQQQQRDQQQRQHPRRRKKVTQLPVGNSEQRATLPKAAFHSATLCIPQIRKWLMDSTGCTESSSPPPPPPPNILPQTAAATATSSAAATGTGRGSSSTNGSWSVSGTLRHKIALRRIRSRGHPRRGASLLSILLTPTPSLAQSRMRCGRQELR